MGNLIVTQKKLEKLEKKMVKGLASLKEELVKQRKYEAGDYYRPLTSIWEHDSCDFDGAAADWKNVRQKDVEAIEFYKDPEKRVNCEVRYFKDKFVSDKLFPVGDQSMAHLIPNDASCSLAWLRALSIVTGIDTGSECPLFDENLRDFVEGKAPQGGNISTDVPLKMWNWNFLKLPEHHEKHFDKLTWTNEEQMVASPIWDPNDKWEPGTGYKLMIAAKPKTYQWLMGKEMLTEDSKQYKWLGEASSVDLQKATGFLALTVKALADLLYQYGESDLEKVMNPSSKEMGKADGEEDTSLESVFRAIEGAIPEDMMSQRSFHDNSSAGNSSGRKPAYKKKAADFLGKIMAVNNVPKNNLETRGRRHVQIPKLIDEGSKNPVLVVDLGVYFKGKEHLIPDPFLVVLKAAVSWSTLRNQELLPACGSHCDHRQDVRNEEMIPAEIFAIAGEDAAQDDDDSSISYLSVIGPLGDGNFKIMPTVSPSGKSSVAVVIP